MVMQTVFARKRFHPVCLCAYLVVLLCLPARAALPKIDIPEMPPIRASLVTAGGQRLLLNYVPDAKIGFDTESRAFSTNKPNWWFINYPLDRIEGIEGLDADRACMLMFGRPADEIRNWYLRIEGTPPPEPSPPDGPAPIDLTPNPDIIVNAGNTSASDNNPGTFDQPLKSITAAISRASAGTLIHVYPGQYGALSVTKSGTAGQPIVIEGVRGGDGGGMPVISGTGAFVQLFADFIHFKGFEVQGGGQPKMRGQLQSGGEGLVIDGCSFRGSASTCLDLEFGNLFRSNKSRYDTPDYIANNWCYRPGQTGIKSSVVGSSIQLSLQDGDANGRLPALYEYNVTIDANQGGFENGWEAGGFKMMQNAFNVVRYNTCIGGLTHGIWFDWTHYNHRIEGNLFIDNLGFGVGTEASPGPNLMANNVVVNHKIRDYWFRAGLISWDSDRNWAVNNTVDGKWNSIQEWNGQVGPVGINIAPAASGRNVMPYGAFQNTYHAAYDNVVAGCVSALWINPNTTFDRGANYTDRGENAEPLGDDLGFVDQANNDFRLKPSSPLAGAGTENEYTGYVRHDFYGLLRFPEDGRSAGAFRADPQIAPGNACLEMELSEGSMVRKMLGEGRMETGPDALPRCRYHPVSAALHGGARPRLDVYQALDQLAIADMAGRLVFSACDVKPGAYYLGGPWPTGAYAVRVRYGGETKAFAAMLR